jgi:hypothetical protein
MDQRPESQPIAATMPVNAPQPIHPQSRGDEANRSSSASVTFDIPRSNSPSQITPTPSNTAPPRPPPQQESILVKPSETDITTQRSSTSSPPPPTNASSSEGPPHSKPPPRSAYSVPPASGPSVSALPPPLPAKPTPRQVTIDDRATMSTSNLGTPPSASSHMPSLSDSSLLMPPLPPAASTRPRRTSYADATPSTQTIATVLPPRASTPTTSTSPEVWYPIYSSSNPNRPGANANPLRRQNTTSTHYYSPHPSRTNTGNNTGTHDEIQNEFGIVVSAPPTAAVDDRRYSNPIPASMQLRPDSERRNSARPFSIRTPSQHENGNEGANANGIGNGNGNGALNLSRANSPIYEKGARSPTSGSLSRTPPTVRDRIQHMLDNATKKRDIYAAKGVYSRV